MVELNNLRTRLNRSVLHLNTNNSINIKAKIPILS